MDTCAADTRTTLSLAPMFSERQVEIMNLLWERGSATSREAWEAMDQESTTYRGILATFQSLEETGYVRHSEPDGDEARFHPAVSRAEAEREAVDHVLRRLFRQSPETMIDALLPEGCVTRRTSDDGWSHCGGSGRRRDTGS